MRNFVNLSVCGQGGFFTVTALRYKTKTGCRTFMAKVELKQPVVAEIAELFNGAKSAVVVDYRGLTVEQDTALRKKLRKLLVPIVFWIRIFDRHALLRPRNDLHQLNTIVVNTVDLGVDRLTAVKHDIYYTSKILIPVVLTDQGPINAWRRDFKRVRLCSDFRDVVSLRIKGGRNLVSYFGD